MNKQQENMQCKAPHSKHTRPGIHTGTYGGLPPKNDFGTVVSLTFDLSAFTVQRGYRAAAAEFICDEKNIHVYINVKDRRAARKE